MRKPIRGRSLMWVGGVVVAGISAVAGVIASVDRGDGAGGEGAAVERQALTDYEEAILPMMKDGGRVVQLGMKPGATDIDEGTYDRQTLRDMARAWTVEMEHVRERFLAVEPPAFLEEFAVRLDRALWNYVMTARTLAEAVDAADSPRRRLVEQALDLGEESDELYDAAWELMDRHRQHLGLRRRETPAPSAGEETAF